ncbi:MAG: carbonate dehydratase [Verrucomicrobia bacterium]|nr:MAG: carbonate dehydratase [Verrucomicrobiota bacterium]
MRVLKHLFDNNRAWAEGISRSDPEFFQKLARQQAPSYLWIGCSDSRVPANQIVGLLPGEMFVHRNIANVVESTDLNCLSVLQFAVDVLKVQHVIVCGHYGCAGIRAALRGEQFGLVDDWLRFVSRVRQKHAASLDVVSDEAARADRLCELNVIEQVMNVCQTNTCRAAWTRGQTLTTHGWIYGIQDGLLRDLSITVKEFGGVQDAYQRALSALVPGPTRMETL